MGYRSVMITDDTYTGLPDWFVEKYEKQFNFGERDGKPAFPISSKFETKFYMGAEDERFLDIARIIREQEDDYPKMVDLLLLHEDGQVSKVTIFPNAVKLLHGLEADEDSSNWQLGDSETYEIPND